MQGNDLQMEIQTFLLGDKEMVRMTSKVSKGKKYVNEAIVIFEEGGFKCWKPGNKAHWIGPGRVVSQSQDIFECFDFEAFDRTRLVYIQVKADEGDASRARSKIDALGMPRFNGDLTQIVLMRLKGQRYSFKKWVLDGDGQWKGPMLLQSARHPHRNGWVPRRRSKP